MGSFNTKCFASGQTIATGDKCLVIPIEQASTYRPIQLNWGGKNLELYGAFHSRCHPDSFWTPLCGGFTATYDDCGRFQLERTDHNLFNLTHWVRMLRDECPVTLAGDNEYHELSFNFGAFLAKEAPHVLACEDATLKNPVEQLRETYLDEAIKCWDYAFKVSGHSRLFRTHKGPRAVQFAVLHHLVADELVSMASSGLDYNSNSVAPRDVFERAVLTGREAADATDYTACPIELAMRKGWAFRMEATEVFKERGGLSLGTRAEQAHLRHVLGRIQTGEWSTELAFEQFLPTLRGRYIFGSLETLALHFEPMMCTGQDYDNSVGKDFAQFIQKVSSAVTKERHEVHL
jgi:hypothetical protein